MTLQRFAKSARKPGSFGISTLALGKSTGRLGAVAPAEATLVRGFRPFGLPVLRVRGIISRCPGGSSRYDDSRYDSRTNPRTSEGRFSDDGGPHPISLLV
jgi:hypothetical protein